MNAAQLHLQVLGTNTENNAAIIAYEKMENSGLIVGAQILPHEGSEIIQSAAFAIPNKITVEVLANQLFPILLKLKNKSFVHKPLIEMLVSFLVVLGSLYRNQDRSK